MKIEDAIRRYESWAEDDRIDILIRKEHRQMADWLKELKTDRPQGEWIRIEWNESIEGNIVPMRVYKCSACEEKEAASTRFCPNCGASMKGADDE